MILKVRLATLTLAVLATLAACGSGTTSSTGVPPSGPTSGTPGGSNPPPPPVSKGKFSLDLSADKTVILQGSDATVTVTLTREDGFDGAVQVSFVDLPAGVSAVPAAIAAGTTTAAVTLVAQGSAPHSLPTTVTVKAVAGDLSATKTLAVTVRGLPGAIDTSVGYRLRRLGYRYYAHGCRSS